jgi:quinol monooxygenase YgiN
MSGDLAAMPGCLSYVIAKDSADPDKLIISEVWDSQGSHRASLNLEAVKDAIQKARPLISGMTRIAETEPVGGVGL